MRTVTAKLATKLIYKIWKIMFSTKLLFYYFSILKTFDLIYVKLWKIKFQKDKKYFKWNYFDILIFGKHFS
jgi:hypothetical protein